MQDEGGNTGLTDTQRSFLVRYLGLKLDTGPAASNDAGTTVNTGQTGGLLSVWIDAKDEADRELNALVGALRGSGLPLFERIADAGLHAITKGQFVALHAALADYDRVTGPAQKDAQGPARKAVQAMRSFLTSEPAVGLIEKNPFGVAVALRDRLGTALDKIDDRLDA